MSLHPQALPAVPEITAATARAAFPHGNRYMAMRDELGTFYADQDFANLFPTRGQPAETPWRLALVLVFQFAEGLSDEQAAEAVRSRIDWKVRHDVAGWNVSRCRKLHWTQLCDDRMWLPQPALLVTAG